MSRQLNYNVLQARWTRTPAPNMRFAKMAGDVVLEFFYI